MWQDSVITVVTLCFIFFSAPQIIDTYRRDAKINLVYGGVTSIGLFVLAFVFFTLGLYFTMVAEFISAMIWVSVTYFSYR